MKNIFLWSVIVIALASCSKDKNKKPCDADPLVTITQGSWTYSKFFIEDILVLGTGDTLSGSLLEPEGSCESIAKWIFNPDHSISLEHDSTDCNDYQNYGEWSLDGSKFITHEEDENEYRIHTFQCITENEITGIIEVDDTNLSIPRLKGKIEFVLTKN